MAESDESRQARREIRQRKKRFRMAQHGRRLAQTYRDAILKRLKRRKKP